MSSSSGNLINLSYSALRGWNHSRRLLRLRLRRKNRACEEKPGNVDFICSIVPGIVFPDSSAIRPTLRPPSVSGFGEQETSAGVGQQYTGQRFGQKPKAN